MGKPTGFMEIARRERDYQSPEQRILHFDEFLLPMSDDGETMTGLLGAANCREVSE